MWFIGSKTFGYRLVFQVRLNTLGCILNNALCSLTNVVPFSINFLFALHDSGFRPRFRMCCKISLKFILQDSPLKNKAGETVTVNVILRLVTKKVSIFDGT